LLEQQQRGHEPVGAHRPRIVRRTGQPVAGFEAHPRHMTTSTAPTTTDPRRLLDRAVATTASVLDGIRPDQRTAPTPCPDFDVAGLAEHLVQVLQRLAAIGRGVPDVMALPLDPVTGDHPAAWRAAAAEVASAWSDDASLERTVLLPWSQDPGDETLRAYLSELTVHTWDLAVATGQHADFDDEVVETAYAAMTKGRTAAEHDAWIDGLMAGAREVFGDDVERPFARVVPVPDDAPTLDRLVAWNGRRPR
jgi:uncharacterized protein (TIGR03086 family)